jgi:hypothetical protein
MSGSLDAQALAGELAAEHGHTVPPSLIRTAVETAAVGGPAQDPMDAERIARADVAALAAAVRRSRR